MNLICPKCANEYSIPEGVFKSETITTFKCHKCNHEDEKKTFEVIQELKAEKIEEPTEQVIEEIPTEEVPMSKHEESSNIELMQRALILTFGLLAICLITYFVLIK